MRTLSYAILLAAVLAVSLQATPAQCGTLTLFNQSGEQYYCAVFDLWSFSGPSQNRLSCGPNQTASFKAPTLDAIGKIAVYKLQQGNDCDASLRIPDARHDPGGMLLPSRDFTVLVHEDGVVKVVEVD